MFNIKCYGQNGNVVDKELVNLDGTLFFIKLKEYITGEELDIRDFFFRSNGKLAIWSDPRIKLSLV